MTHGSRVTRVVAHGRRLASIGQAIVAEVDPAAGVLRLRAPFYRRELPLSSIVSATTAPDDGLNHGLVNWFVTGSSRSPQGVRLNTGGSERVDVTTVDGRRYGIVVDTPEQAERLVAALKVSPR